MVLDPNGKQRGQLKELRAADISGPGRDPDDTSSNSRYEPSWIWLVSGPAGSTPVTTQANQVEFHESMRVEWVKTRARVRRWTEERQLVLEEMRRVLAYLRWKSKWWIDAGQGRDDISPELTSGVRAYANKQAAICIAIAYQCASHWQKVLKAAEIIPEWVCDWNGIAHIGYEPSASNTEDADEDDDDTAEEDGGNSDNEEPSEMYDEL